MYKYKNYAIISFAMVGLMAIAMGAIFLLIIILEDYYGILGLSLISLGVGVILFLLIGTICLIKLISYSKNMKGKVDGGSSIENTNKGMDESVGDPWLINCPKCGSVRLDMTRPDKAQCYSCGKLTLREDAIGS